MAHTLVDKNILITGGAGFIGSHLVERLCPYNKTIVLDNLSMGDYDNIKSFNIDFVKSDVTNNDLVKILKDKQIDIVFHLASYRLDQSLRNPLEDFRVNALGGIRVIQACLEANISRLIYTSTGSVYGEPKMAHHDEEHDLRPTTPYGVSKLCTDHYCRLYYKLYKLNTVCLRYYNVYGSRRLSGAIPKFILQALQGETITIDGGKQTRTPTYVSDVIDATVLAATSEKAVGDCFNIAAEEFASVEDLAKKIIRLCDAEEKSRLEYGDYRPGEIMHLRPSVDKSERILGWKAKTELEEGLKKQINYLREVANG